MKRSYWVVLGIAVVAAAAGAAWQFRKAAPAPAAAPPPSASAEPPSFPGIVRARHIVPVAAPIDGVLEGLEVTDGQEIAEGQLLAHIRNNSLELEAQQAQEELAKLESRISSLESEAVSARLEQSRAEADSTRARLAFAAAEKDYARQKLLYSEGAAPRLTFEKSEKEYERLKAESTALTEIARQSGNRLQALQRQLDETRKQLAGRRTDFEDATERIQQSDIRAPVTGVLLSHRANNGDEVAGDLANLFEIAVDLTELTVAAEVPEAVAKDLQPGAPAWILLAETGPEPISGTIDTVQGTAVAIHFAAPSPAARPGLTAQVRFRP